MKKILIVGLGIGQLYKNVLESHYEVFTIDIDNSKNPNFNSVAEALEAHRYDLAIICLPNRLHEPIALLLDGEVPIILVEKPGFQTESRWKNYLKSGSKLVMVKNNLFRDLDLIKREIKNSFNGIEIINIQWINENRIPNPGSWFTDSSKSFGGVERDLVPHLLSIFYGISPDIKVLPEKITLKQNHNLGSLSSTEYGSIGIGKYDVFDYCEFQLGEKFRIIADWKSDRETRIGVEIKYKNGQVSWHDFGLCPEEFYLKMVEETLNYDSNLPNFDKKYKQQNKIDLFIHRIIDNLK